MDASSLALPIGIAFAGLLVLLAVSMVLRSRRRSEQAKLSVEQREELANERREAWRRRLGVAALTAGCVMLLAIAAIAGWLSFSAQREYAFTRNGGDWTTATGFAVLLDAGTLGLSLFRFFEALTLRSSLVTRLFLFAFIGAAVQMNYLHAPADDFGSRFVAVIPPLVYAVLLEMLLHKIEQVIMGKRAKQRKKKDRERGYSLILWVPGVGYPIRMWKAWREDLLSTISNVRAPGSLKPLASHGEEEQEQQAVAAAAVSVSVRTAPVQVHDPAPAPPSEPVTNPSAPIPIPRESGIAVPRQPEPAPLPAPPALATTSPTVRQPAPPAQTRTKKEQLREALVEQIRRGDYRVLSDSSQESNAAAYQVNRRLGEQAGQTGGLMADGAVRAAVKQLLPELRQVKAEIEEHAALESVRAEDDGRRDRAETADGEARRAADEEETREASFV